MRRLAPLAALCLLVTATASAQTGLDGLVGPDGGGGPLEFRAFTTHALGSFARAAHVPVGIELLPETRIVSALPPVTLTGRTVRDAAALMVLVDSRYTWREDAGVILFEPARPYESNPLDQAAPAVQLAETNGRLALTLVAALLGAPRSTAIYFADSKAFRLDVPDGTIRALLDAIVRAHGELVWVLDRPAQKDRLFPYVLTFMSGPHGFGLGLSGEPPLVVPDPAHFLSSDAGIATILDAPIGLKRDGYRLELAGGWDSAVADLARTVRAPFGFQMSAARPQPGDAKPEPFVATGRTLRDVLDTLAARDSRYTWRVIDGTIVVRPSHAWSDPADPLFALVPDIEAQDASMTTAVRKVLTALGGDAAALTFPDGRNVSFLVVGGTALDLLNALARSHGSLAWTFAAAETKEIEATGLAHRLTLSVSGDGGYGYLVR